MDTEKTVDRDDNWVTTSHTVARIMFRHQWKASHPHETEAQLNAAWEEGGEEYRRIVRSSLRALQEKGIYFGKVPD